MSYIPMVPAGEVRYTIHFPPHQASLLLGPQGATIARIRQVRPLNFSVCVLLSYCRGSKRACSHVVSLLFVFLLPASGKGRSQNLGSLKA